MNGDGRARGASEPYETPPRLGAGSEGQLRVVWLTRVTECSYPLGLQWGTLGFVREIRWTSESEAHIARHGITPEEVEQAVNSRPRYEAPGCEDSTLLYCVTDDGRPCWLYWPKLWMAAGMWPPPAI
jgi:hypothetical protein